MADDKSDSDKIRIPRFDGSTDVERWLKLVDSAAAIKKWDGDTKLTQATLRLDGSALQWAENSGATNLASWDLFTQALKLRYKVTLNDAAVRAELAKIKRTKGETIFQYSDRIQAVAIKAAEKLSETTLVQYLIKGINREMQFPLFLFMKEHDTATMVEVVRLINDYEALGFNTAMPTGSDLALMVGEMKPQLC